MLRRVLPLLFLSCCHAPAAVPAPEPAVLVASIERELLENCAERLETRCPTPAPVRIAFAEKGIPGGYLGLTRRIGNHILIELDMSHAYQVELDTLIHEWAHAVVLDVKQRESHDAVWGVAFSWCYQAVHGPAPIEPIVPPSCGKN